MPTNPYAPPNADFAEPLPEDAPPIWNPNAAAGWSLLFSPVFGSFLHMKNWQALGRPDKARQSMWWAILVLLTLLLTLAWRLVTPDREFGQKIGDLVNITLLALWYFASGREQVQTVKRFTDYEKRGWGIPLIVAFFYVVICGAVSSQALNGGA